MGLVRTYRYDVAAVGIIFVATLILVRSVVFGDDNWGLIGLDRIYSVVPIFSALSHQHAPWRVLEGMIGGLPLYNNGNFSPYYPFYFIWTHLYGSHTQSIHTADAISILHLFLGCFSTFLGLRLLRLRPLPSLIAGVSYGLSANALDTAVWLHFGAGYAWMPLALLGTLAIGTGDKRVLIFIATVAASTLALHAFPAQVALHLLSAGPMFGVVGLLEATPNGRLRPALLRLGVMAIVILGINAAVAVPIAFPDQTFIRWFDATHHQVGGGAVPAEFLFQSSVAPRDFISLILHTNYHSLVGNVFVGLPIVLLAVLSLRFAERRRVKAGLYAITTIWLIVLCGDQTPAGAVISHLPFFNQVRNPPRHMPIILTAVTALAALGLNDLMRAVRGQHLRIWFSRRALFAALLIGVALVLIGNPHSVEIDMTARWVLFWLATALVLAVLAWPQMRLIYLAAFLLIAAQAAQAPPVNSLAVVSAPSSPPFLQMERGLRSATVVESPPPGRLLFFGPPLAGDARYAMSALGSGAAVLFGYFAPLPYDQFQRYFDFGVKAGKINLMRGSRYLLTALPQVPEGWEVDRKMGMFTLYKNPSAYPMSYGSYSVAGLADPDDSSLQAVEALLEQKTLPSVVIGSDAASRFEGLSKTDSDHSPEVSPPTWHGNDVHISVKADAPAVVGLNVYDGPAWRPYVNGISVSRLRVNGVHPGVIVPAGESEIVFHYGSRTTDWLYRIRLIALFAFAAYVAWKGIAALLRLHRLRVAKPRS